MNIKNLEEQYEGKIKCYVDNLNGLAQLQIFINKMKIMEKEREYEIKHIKCQIEFSSIGSSKNCIIDCEFNIEILPLKIIVYCKECHLAQNDINNYTLCLKEIISGNSINLFFKNYNLKKNIEFTFKIEPLNNNTSNRPKIIKKNDCLELIVDNKDSQIKRLNCELTINFNNFFIISISIDCFIIPFFFKFEIYDYNNKLFSPYLDIYLRKNIESITSKNIINYNIYPVKYPLHFKVTMPNYNYEGNVELIKPNSNYFSINNINLPSSFNTNFAFDLELIINNNILENQKNLKKSFPISLKLKNITKKIDINIIIIEKLIYNNKSEYKDLILESYSENIWKNIQFCKKTSYSITYVSQFGLEPSFSLKYFDNKNPPQYFQVTSDRNKILKATFNSYKYFILKSSIKFELEENHSYSYNGYNNKIKKIGIIGYPNEDIKFWYRIIFSI